MAEILQYKPAYFTGFDKKTVEFSTIEQLKEIPFVKDFAQLKNFHQFSYSKMAQDRYALMAEYKEGYEWWVIGYMDDAKLAEQLPEWKEKSK